MNTKQILIIIRQTPYSSTLPAAALDVLLTSSAFEQDVSLLFYGDGILHCLDKQNADGTGMKNISKALPSLDLYDVEKIYYVEDSLTSRKLKQDSLLIQAEPVSTRQLAEFMEQADQVFNF